MADASMWSVVDVQPLADRRPTGGMVNGCSSAVQGCASSPCGQVLIVAHAAHAHISTTLLVCVLCRRGENVTW